MIDFHSHILPLMDDGSKSVQESIELLKILKQQGINKVVATSHYYPEIESVEDFLKRREDSYILLKKEMLNDLPDIVLGAEVKFYPGISRMENLEKLCVENSRVLLLEMPFTYWTEFTLKEVIDLANLKNITVVLAHIDRYFSYQTGSVWQKLFENGILMQANADSFMGLFSRIKVFKFLKKGWIHFIGSDCHNLITRPPKIGEALNIIFKKFGSDYVNFMTDFDLGVLNQSE